MTDLYDDLLARIRGESALIALQTLTVPDMARLLGLSETTIRTYATARQYIHLLPRPFKRPGGRRLLWDADEVRAWLAAGTAPFDREAAQTPWTTHQGATGGPCTRPGAGGLTMITGQALQPCRRQEVLDV